MSGLKRYLFPQGIAGQVTGILVVALMLSQVLAAAVYVLLAPQWEMRLRPRLVAAKIVTVVRIIESLPVEQRQTATIAAGSNFSFANSAISSSQAAVTPVGSQDDRFGQWIAAGIDRAQGDIAVTAGPTDSSVSTTRVEIPLRGGGWLTVSVNSQDTLRLGTLQQFAAFGFLFITIGGVAIWLTQRVVSPLSQLADAAEQFGLKGEAPPLPEQGPMEVRRAARTFNLMQERLRRFVEDRTRMLAAISHDLRTPLTRLRLRVETDESADQHGKMLHDIKMMEEMLTSTLAFTRDAEEMETAESVDLASLLQTICDDFADSGAEISFDGPRHQAFYCRPQLLMRAMSNLIGNAAKYGNSVVVRLRPDAGKGIVIVDIEDDGPGIPDAEKERVFEPFYRLDPARGVDSGGIGLGLAIARTIILSHGGEIRLLDRQPGGLIARVLFPDEKRARDHADFGTRLATDHEGGPFREAKETIKKILQCGSRDKVTVMTMTTAARDTASRRLLLSSLALNFFFIGIIGAFATRFHFAAIHPTGRPHTAAARIEWLAERLGPADAEKLRIAFHPRETEAEHTREAVGRAYERLRETLRAEPFDSGALRTAMAEVRAVRLIYEQTVHEIVIAAVPMLSHEGRIALAK